MASCARRFGRNPYEHGRKSASKMGLSTSLRTACTTRSVTVESPAWGQFPARLGNLDLTYLDRLERPRPQLLTHAQPELLDPDPGGDPGHRGPVHPRGPRPRVPRDALPRHHRRTPGHRPGCTDRRTGDRGPRPPNDAAWSASSVRLACAQSSSGQTTAPVFTAASSDITVPPCLLSLPSFPV